MGSRKSRASLSLLVLWVAWGCTSAPTAHTDAWTDASFTVVVIPDTQNAIDYTHQKAAGFAIDSSDVFIEQMRQIAGRAVAAGGDVVFVAAVGDVWQHQAHGSDAAHRARGVTAIDNPLLSLQASLAAPGESRTIEIPKAIEGYRLISDSGIPFGVAPGNHDYDSVFSVAGFPPALDKPAAERTFSVEDLGMIHVSGLDNFRSAFGSDTDFFRAKDWYVGAHDGGASSAQVFAAGGYRFLHFAFQMQVGDEVLAWAQAVIDKHPGLPTIVSTHDYLNPRGERKPAAIMDLAIGDPDDHNNAETIWRKFIRKNEQIFIVLSGHQLGQAMRVDANDAGFDVYQLLADYQERGQAGVDAGQPFGSRGRAVGIGDGWFREMTFHLGAPNPTIDVKTYSSHYKTYSSDLDTYASWYRELEQPKMSAKAFFDADDFTIELTDFYLRFGPPGASRAR